MCAAVVQVLDALHTLSGRRQDSSDESDDSDATGSSESDSDISNLPELLASYSLARI